jgi:hypothetical protein
MTRPQQSQSFVIQFIRRVSGRADALDFRDENGIAASEFVVLLRQPLCLIAEVFRSFLADSEQRTKMLDLFR